jgi:lipoprotein-anchoring transpeptidase ErfK/SrfK
MRYVAGFLLAVGLAAPLALSGAAYAANDFVVIPGIGPPLNSQASPPLAPPPPAPAAPVAQTRSALGGGLLEFLVTGRDPGAPQPAPVAAIAPAPVPAPNVALASIAAQDPQTAEVEGEPEAIYRRHEIVYSGAERPGTIVIDTSNKFLYFVEPEGRALRYGIGVGRPGFEWAGVKTVTRKAEWPGWTPPIEMMLRRPDLPSHMAGGPDNPLGARALYLGSSLYRIHGTNDPSTIGKNVSSGCIRMMNEDVIDLYDRAKVGTKVIVM